MGSPRYWRCENTTRNVLIGDKIKRADNYFTRLIGLLPRKGLSPGEGLWIVPCKDIHSIGMQFVFDAIFLDKQGVVVHLVQRMKPLRVTPMIRGAHSVLELDGGVIEATGTQVGDILAWTAPDAQ